MTESDPGSPGAPAPAPKADKTRTWLVTQTTEAFGPAGSFLELTAAQAKAAPEGVLVEPDETQLAMRPKVPVHPLADADPQPKG
jgi:hypothetical protein